MEDKKIKIEFAPGCFDNFEGTQEELDTLVGEIQNIFSNPKEIESRCIPLDPDTLNEEQLADLAHFLFNDEEIIELERMGMPVSSRGRTLQ